MPAIDGLRALSVLAVLLFHAGLGGASGGYLGVSVFFTISGFVITRSLLERAELRPPGAAPVALGSFYARRVRRLLPAGLATILVCAWCARAGWLPRLSASELRWTVLNGANWYQWRSGGDYAAVFAASGGGREPLIHFWSLAIEEQFYVAWPLVMLVVLRLPRRVAVASVAALTVALSLLPVAVGSDPRTVYYHTLFRAPEVLAGCLLAFVIVPLTARHGRTVSALGLVALAAVALAVTVTGAGSDAWPYQGWLPVFAIGSAAVVAAACVPGPAAALLSVRPFVELGRISYGVYLFHWPIFVVLLDRGWSPTAIAAVGVPLTVVLAAASFHLAEVRITRARAAFGPTLLAGLTGVVAVLAATTVTVGRVGTSLAMPELDPAVLQAVDFAPVASSPGTDRPARASTSTTAPAARTATPTSPPTTPPATPPATPATTSAVTPQPHTTPPATVAQPLRVLVVGDSTAESLSAGFTEWALDHPDVQVSVAAFGACGLVRGGEYRLGLLDAALQVECAERHARTIPDALPMADVVVALVTLADVWERSWDGGTTWLGPTDPEFRDRLAADYRAFADEVAAAGVPTLLWLRPPPSAYAADGATPVPEATFADGTQAWIESVVRDLAEARPGSVAIGDLRAWWEASGLAGDPAARPDGTHFAADAARRITEEWLVPQLAALPRRG